jgi:hypothetical protein
LSAAEVTDQANDKRQVQPMVSQAQENLVQAGVEEKIAALDADCGYYSEENVSYLEKDRQSRFALASSHPKAWTQSRPHAVGRSIRTLRRSDSSITRRLRAMETVPLPRI